MMAIADYISHQPPMRLVERIVEVNRERAITESTIGPDNAFYDPGEQGVPAWAGLEYMAQTAAVWVGAECLRVGTAIEPAFLISSRHYNAERTVFARGKTLRVSVTPELINGPLVAFVADIRDGAGRQVAEANFTAYQPEDIDAYLQGSEPHMGETSA